MFNAMKCVPLLCVILDKILDICKTKTLMTNIVVLNYSLLKIVNFNNRISLYDHIITIWFFLKSWTNNIKLLPGFSKLLRWNILTERYDIRLQTPSPDVHLKRSQKKPKHTHMKTKSLFPLSSLSEKEQDDISLK